MPDDASFSRRGPTNAMRYAAELELFLPRQGEGRFSNAPLEIEVSLGEQEFRDKDGIGFCLRFRRVIVEIIPKYCEIERDQRYRRTLPREDFTQFLKRVVEKGRLGRVGAKAGMNGLSKILAAVGIDMALTGEVAASLESNNTQTIESKVDFPIVRWVAAGRWEIGHSVLGDPSELDGCLKGGYFGDPGDGRTPDDYNPLCILKPRGSRDYHVDIELRAKFGDCAFRSLSDERDEEEWAKKNKEEIMRILALKLLREQNRSDGLEPPDDELILGRSRLIVKQVKEGCQDE